MARWDRDPRRRQQAGWLVAAIEALALAANFYYIFSAYFNQVFVRLDVTFSDLAASLTVWVAAAACLAAALVEGVYYVRGRLWARRALIVENAALIVLGLVWFAHNRVAGAVGIQGQWEPAFYGILLPMLTLFPLMWPLLAFRPAGTAAPQS
jgi:hypothetical protein